MCPADPGPSIACPAFHCTPFPFACAVQISSQSLITLSFHRYLISAGLTHSETSEERFVSIHIHAAVDVEISIELVPVSLQFRRCKGSHTTHAHASSADGQVSKVECCDVCNRRRARLRQARETVLTGLDRHGQCGCSDCAGVCSDDWDALNDRKTVSHLRTVVLAALLMMHGREVHQWLIGCEAAVGVAGRWLLAGAVPWTGRRCDAEHIRRERHVGIHTHSHAHAHVALRDTEESKVICSVGGVVVLHAEVVHVLSNGTAPAGIGARRCGGVVLVENVTAVAGVGIASAVGFVDTIVHLGPVLAGSTSLDFLLDDSFERTDAHASLTVTSQSIMTSE